MDRNTITSERLGRILAQAREKKATAQAWADTNAGRTRFGEVPHVDDVWISVEDAAEYAAYIDAKATELASWVSLGEEPEDVAQCLSPADTKTLILNMGSFGPWFGKWKMAYEDFQKGTFQGSWEGLVQWHKELKSFADTFGELAKKCAASQGKPQIDVPPPQVEPPPEDVPKFGPGQNQHSDTMALGIVALGVFGAWLLFKR